MIDELNNLVPYENKIIDLNKWLDDFYEVMDIDEEQKEKRKNLAHLIRESFLFLYSVLRVMAENNSYDYNIALSAFRSEFRSAIDNYVRIDLFMENYIQTFTRDYLDTTINHLSQDDASFFFSEDRATIGGANESNTVIGYGELEDAIDEGYEKKRWKTERDSRVRSTHRELEGVTIPIDDYFDVGGSYMLYPGDPEGDPKETANCRCVLEYL